MATQTLTRPKQDQTVRRQDPAAATALRRRAAVRENGAGEHAQRPDVDGVAAAIADGSAGRTGVRQGTVSELTVIAPFAPGGAARLRAVLQSAERQLRRHGPGGHRPRHAFRVSGQRHQAALRHGLRRRLGRLHRRLRGEDPRRNGRPLFVLGKAGRAFTARR